MLCGFSFWLSVRSLVTLSCWGMGRHGNREMEDELISERNAPFLVKTVKTDVFQNPTVSFVPKRFK